MGKPANHLSVGGGLPEVRMQPIQAGAKFSGILRGMKARGHQHSRGMSIGFAVVLMTLLATVAFGMVTLFTINLNLMQVSSNGAVALDEAEAGLSQVLLNLATDPDYGTRDESFQRTLNTSFGDQA